MPLLQRRRHYHVRDPHQRANPPQHHVKIDGDLLLRLRELPGYVDALDPGHLQKLRIVPSKIVDARIAYLNGLFYVTFDALALDPGERPQVHDFRASELFAAGRELGWVEVV